MLATAKPAATANSATMARDRPAFGPSLGWAGAAGPPAPAEDCAVLTLLTTFLASTGFRSSLGAFVGYARVRSANLAVTTTDRSYVVRFDRPGDVFLADCPARLTLEVIADKWSLVALHALGSRPWRHGEL